MKKIISISIFILSTVLVFAQAPEKMSYQAVARDLSGLPLANTTVVLQFEILEASASGLVVYRETQSKTTNQFGLFAAEIGSGTVLSGAFAGIVWGTNAYYLRITVNGDVMPATQLLSVPYALYSKTSGGAGAALIAGPGIDITGGVITSTLDTSLTNELQVISISNDSIFLSDGGFVQLPAAVGDNWGTDTVSYQAANITGQGTVGNPLIVIDNDTSLTNELQVISISNDTIFLSDGGFVQLPVTVNDTDWTQGTGLMYNLNDNVGIGTPTPSQKLDVVGTAEIDSLRINNSYAFPALDGTNGQILTTNGAGVVNWESVIGSSSLSDADGDTEIDLEAIADQDVIHFSLGNGVNASTEKWTIIGNRLESKNSGQSTFIGENAGLNTDITLDRFNVAVGDEALRNSIISSHNTAIGYQAMTSISGNNNTAVGYFAMRNSGGSNNTVMGHQALLSGGGDDNTSIGFQSLANTNGNDNTALGFQAGNTNGLGDKNTFIGYDADASLNNLTNATAIGANSSVGASNSLILGSITGVNGATANTNVGIGTTTPTNLLHLKGDQDPQLLVEPQATSGEDAGIIIRSARRVSGLHENARISFENFDSDLSASNSIGTITGKITNGGLNIGDLVFYNYIDGSTRSETMRLTNTGNVGVGATNPSARLHSSGTLRLESLGGATPSAGSVLTAIDANGNAQWQTPAGGVDTDWTEDASFVYNNSGKRVVVGSAITGTGTQMEIETPTSRQIALMLDNNYTGANQTFGITTDITDLGTGLKYGYHSFVRGNAAQTNDIIGVFNQIATANTETSYGVYNSFAVSSGTGVRYGIWNEDEDYNYFSGMVGIGTTTPTNLLHVSGNFSNIGMVGSFIDLQNTFGSNTSQAKVGILFKTSNNPAGQHTKGGVIYSRTSSNARGDIHFLNNSNDDVSEVDYLTDTKMIIKNDGNVGIGTNNPPEKLYISDGNFGMFKDDGSDLNITLNGDDNGISWTMGNEDSNLGYFKIASSGSLGLNTRLTISDGGNVGIGVAIPTAKLEVNGTQAFQKSIQFLNNGGQIDPNISSYVEVTGSGAVITLGDPCILNGTTPGQILYVISNHGGTDTFTSDATVQMSTPFVMGGFDTITFMWTGVTWVEMTRSNN